MQSKPSPGPPPDLTIRRATPGDIAAITAIYAHAVRTGTATFEIEPPDQADMLRRFETLSAGGFPYLVAMENNALAGYAYAGPYRTRSAFRFTVEDSVYLAPQARQRGIGGALLNALIDDCITRGFRQIVAVIGDTANVASIRTHTRAGFAMIGTQPDIGFKFGRWLDIVIMQRALVSPDQAGSNSEA